MLSSVLNSSRAVRINIEIVRTFVAYRKQILTQREILLKLENIANRVTIQENKTTIQGEVMKDLIEQLRRMITPAEKPKKQIGFRKE
ncbi:MAG: hypothetical protein A2044_03600 [Candidatus Firestonebacteria bacterium GWA2_43_8]|nr:MAG: hypothetical protein A2044_03600 [Candidatus Firestonebacteria bacterium GWA2_43_8]